MQKVNPKTAPAVFPGTFQKTVPPYPTNFWKPNYTKLTSQLSRLK